MSYHLDPLEIAERLAVGASLQQIAYEMGCERTTVWKVMNKNEENRQLYLAALQERAFHHATTIEQLIVRLENGELPSDVARVAIDGRKWIASRFHPVMFSERLQQHLTVNKDNFQEEHLKAVKARVQKRLEVQNQQNVVNSE